MSRSFVTRRFLLTVTLLVGAMSFPATAQFGMFGNTKDAAGSSKQIAVFKIKGALSETPQTIPPLFGNEPPLSMKTLLARLKEARLDKNVVAVVVDVEKAQFGLAQLEEFHAALQLFKAVDKDVFVHADSLFTLSYTAATGASHISVVPTGDVWFSGFYTEQPYLRGTLDKLGVTPDFEQCGSHKSAAESLMRTGPSEAANEMMTWIFDSLFESVVNIVAGARDMTPAKVEKLIDGGPYSAEEAKELGLIDSVQYREDFVKGLSDRYGKEADFVIDYGSGDDLELPSDNPFAFFQFLMQMMNPAPKVHDSPSVAIVYVEGAIQGGESEPNPFAASEGAFSTSIRKALDKAAEDNSVKAVVLRVDSPGGSALASEIILEASRRVAAKKPLIVSMGNVAASGGYYVSCAAETIFADPSTITSSIGVIGGKLVTTPMWDKIGVNWHAIQRGDMAGMLSSASSFSQQERAKFRHYMETIYDVFKGHVVKARGDKLTKPIDEIAGGRVFTGKQAKELGLVDKLGGLDDAIKFAANRANLGDYEIRVIPEPATIFDLLMGGGEDKSFSRIGAMGADSLINAPMLQTALPLLAAVDPLRVKAIVQSLQRLELIHQEQAITMMPFNIIVRQK